MAAPKGNHNASNNDRADPRISALDPVRLLDHRKVKVLRLSRAVNGIRKSGRSRGYLFEFSTFEAAQILISHCHYCGYTPELNNSAYNPYNGIDRLDNALGYIKENAVPCCRRCNLAKHVMTEQEFLELALQIVKYRNLG